MALITQVFSYIYALLCLIGGIIGFTKSGSIASLIAGIAICLLVALSTLLFNYTSWKITGVILQSVAAVSMISKMLPAYLSEGGRVMPHLIYTILSGVYVSFILVYYLGLGGVKAKKKFNKILENFSIFYLTSPFLTSSEP